MRYYNRMKPRQYKPYTSNFKAIPCIIYPVKDENPLQDVYKNETEITVYLNELYAKHSEALEKGSYHILFVWNLDGHRMTDVWIHDMKNWSDSGPLLECLTFRGLDTCEDAGIASGDSVIVLGREEELRRTLSSLEEYVDRTKYVPVFPEGMQPAEHFEVHEHLST
jgi:hypothetical protein